METDVAAFARQLKQDGIDAARIEADAILNEARSRAAEILEQAGASAEKAGRDALTEIERQRQRLSAEIGLIARDTILKVRQQIENASLQLLRRPIGEALAADEVVREAIIGLVRGCATAQEWEIRVGPQIGRALVQAVVSDLFKGREATVTLIEEFRTSGLELRTAEGEVVELSEESVAAVFRRLMSPELSRIIDTLPR